MDPQQVQVFHQSKEKSEHLETSDALEASESARGVVWVRAIKYIKYQLVYIDIQHCTLGTKPYEL